MSAATVTATASAKTSSHRRRPAVRFTLHYLEMVAVMFAGMAVFGSALLGIGALLGAAPGELRDDAPALVLLGMGVSMVVPMVLWMIWRGHSAVANREMALAMALPTLGVVALLAAGLVTDVGDLLMLEHVAMLPAMLAVMLLRRDEYSHPIGAHAGS